MKIPRLIISATSSDAGKTIITSAILRIFKERGFKVQPFKIGPDYIDPIYLSKAAGRPCRNLDSWIMKEEGVLKAFKAGCEGVDLAIMEGVRGLYEGESPTGDSGSTAHVAKILSSPVVLVVNCKSLNRSAAAQIIGFKSMDKELNIAGVILNEVRDEVHEEKLRRAIQHYTDVQILGVMYRSKALRIEKRHLGLAIPKEEEIENLIRSASESLKIEVDKVMDVVEECPEMDVEKDDRTSSRESDLKIAVLMDSSFFFYYHENLLALREAGAEICVVNSLSDGKVEEDVSGILIGGGYPELFAKELEENQSLRHCIKKKALDEMPIVGEGGGLLYLCKSLCYKGKSYGMVGVFDGEVRFSDVPVALGYVELRAKLENPLSSGVLRGHEFHYSFVEGLSSKFAFEVLRGKGIRGGMDGALAHNTLGMYAHLHYLACPEVPMRFVSHCRKYARR